MAIGKEAAKSRVRIGRITQIEHHEIIAESVHFGEMQISAKRVHHGTVS
jgi:hypothetical protein